MCVERVSCYCKVTLEYEDVGHPFSGDSASLKRWIQLILWTNPGRWQVITLFSFSSSIIALYSDPTKGSKL